MTPALNKPLPDFEALATSGVKFTPHAFAGRASSRDLPSDALAAGYRERERGQFPL